MKVNPSKLLWGKPTQNVDGTPIDYELNYEVGKLDSTGNTTPFVVIVGSLVENNQYEAPIEDMGFQPGVHKIALRSFSVDEPDRKSLWSDSVEFKITNPVPKSPFGLKVL